jgi:hypothetical protein
MIQISPSFIVFAIVAVIEKQILIARLILACAALSGLPGKTISVTRGAHVYFTGVAPGLACITPAGLDSSWISHNLMLCMRCTLIIKDIIPGPFPYVMTVQDMEPADLFQLFP